MLARGVLRRIIAHMAGPFAQGKLELLVDRPDGSAPPLRYVFDQEEVLVGRAASVEVRLPDAAVSLVHLRLRRRRGQWLVADAGSTNGTQLGGQRVLLNQLLPLPVGVELLVGPFRLRANVAPPERSPITPRDTAAFARQLALQILGGESPSTTALKLVVRQGPQRGREVLIGEAPLLVGRAAHCELCLSDADVSREHLRLSRQPDGLVQLEDLSSKNGICINGVISFGVQTVRPADVLVLGQSELLLVDAVEERLLLLETPDELPAVPPVVVATEPEAGTSGDPPTPGEQAASPDADDEQDALPAAPPPSSIQPARASILPYVAVAAIVAAALGLLVYLML